MKPAEKPTLCGQKVWALFVFVGPGEVAEVRIPKACNKSLAWGNQFAKGTVSGYFDYQETFCEAAKMADKTAYGSIFFTLLVIDPRLTGGAYNRLKLAEVTTTDQNVLVYCYLPIDQYPIRSSGIPSSDSEMTEVSRLREEVAQWVTTQLQFPASITCMSGNGGHLLFRSPDLPATKDTQNFVKNILVCLSERFNTHKIQIDTTVLDQARIWKACGTTARRGDPITPRENRRERPLVSAPHSGAD